MPHDRPQFGGRLCLRLAALWVFASLRTGLQALAARPGELWRRGMPDFALQPWSESVSWLHPDSCSSFAAQEPPYFGSLMRPITGSKRVPSDERKRGLKLGDLQPGASCSVTGVGAFQVWTASCRELPAPGGRCGRTPSSWLLAPASVAGCALPRRWPSIPPLRGQVSSRRPTT
jgi:hypothetical protein